MPRTQPDTSDFLAKRVARAEEEANARLIRGLPKLRAVDAGELLDMEIPVLEPLLGDWLCEKTLGMIHAWRGLGKTWLAFSIAWAVASGRGFLGWRVPRPRKVLYLDGELPARLIQERSAVLARVFGATPAPGMLRIFTPDLNDGPVPDLASRPGQILIDEMIEPDCALVIPDNLSALVRGTGEENEASSWTGVGEWILSHRRAGRAILLIHHQGKGGKQRGTSKREDLLDVVIGLHRPPDYQEADGARFELRFEKARSLTGQALEAREIALEHIDGEPCWTSSSVRDESSSRVIERWDAGLSVTDIAREVGLAKSTVVHHLAAAQALNKLKREYVPRRRKLA